MVQCPVFSRHCIFEGTEFSEVVIEEILHLRQCTCTSCGPSRCECVSQFYANFSINLISLVLKIWWALVFFGWRQTVLFIKVPCSTNWFFTIHQNIEPCSLFPIETLHQVTLLFTRPRVKYGSRSEKEIVLYKTDSVFLKCYKLAKGGWFGADNW